MKPLLPLSLLLLACAVTAPAEPPPARARLLLSLADSPPVLRSQLLAYADSVADADRAGAAEALGHAGASFQREGRVDSAIVCHRRAYDLLGEDERMLALVDQLLLRRGAGDLSEAIGRLSDAMARSEAASPLPLASRLAWARFLKGETDTAAALFAPLERRLRAEPEWRYRMGRVAMARKEYRHAVDLLLPNAIRARGTDDEVVGMLEEAGKELGLEPRIKTEMFRRIGERDATDAALAGTLSGRPVALLASDGFPLSGLLVPARRARAARSGGPPLLAIVLMAPGDTLASGDSLVVALRQHGLTTLMLQPRGFGASVGPSCPSPDAWFDREAALQERVARDVLDAMNGLRRFTPVDSTRCLVAGAGASATMAVEAARLDPRVRALLLVSPAPALVDRGLTRARLAALRLPVFFQNAADDFEDAREITEVLYQAGDRAASRVVESATTGHRLAQFQGDPQLARRFLAWLDATLPPRAPRPVRPAPHPTPPGPHR
jgi:tetratricopeptide (TPR) repeat protein